MGATETEAEPETPTVDVGTGLADADWLTFEHQARRTEQKKGPTKVVRYRRASSDRTMSETSIRSQAKEFDRRAAEKGWDLLRDYGDNNVSGSKTNVMRKEFERMLSDIKMGAVKPELIVAWDISRLMRNHRDKHRLEELMDEGVHLYDMKYGIDSRTNIGRIMFALMAELAIDKAKELAQNLQSAEDLRRGEGRARNLGKNTGLGFRSMSDGNGEFLGYAIVPHEAASIRWAIEGILARRETISSVCNAWNDPASPHHVKPRSGGRFERSTVRCILYAARHAGCVDEFVERDNEGRPTRTRLVENTDGKMPAIVSKENLTAFREILEVNRLKYSEKIQVGGRTPKYLLTGLASCSSCDGGLGASKGATRQLRYRCPECDGLPSEVKKRYGYVSVSILMEVLDEIVTGATVERIRSGALAELLHGAATSDSASDLARQLNAEEHDLDTFIAAAETAEITGNGISHESYMRFVAAKERHIAELRGSLRIELGSARFGDVTLLPDDIADTIEASWEDLDLPWKRRLIQLCWKEIVLLPEQPGSRSNPTARVRLVPRTAADPITHRRSQPLGPTSETQAAAA